MTYQAPEIIEIGKVDEAILGAEPVGEIDVYPLAYYPANETWIDE